ncbi:MAG TPA: Uma2 family endonuclease [Longimicrobium sp.]|nr:Uma2 family endonuclease [Longimicrobium sp.]
MTADELLAMPEDGIRRELVAGELRETSPAGGEHGRVSMRLGWRLAQYVETGKLGVVYSSDTGFRLARDPDTVRCPDFGFVARERYARFTGLVDLAPDLAVEVVSPHDTYSGLRRKVHQFLNAGTRMVIIVDPPSRTADVYRSRIDVRELSENDVIDGGDVVPGWTLPVRDIFA